MRLHVTFAADGALYVDHKMFGKLPDAYTQHPTYRRLFGESVGTRPLSVAFLLTLFLESTGSWAIRHAQYGLPNEEIRMWLAGMTTLPPGDFPVIARMIIYIAFVSLRFISSWIAMTWLFDPTKTTKCSN